MCGIVITLGMLLTPSKSSLGMFYNVLQCQGSCTTKKTWPQTAALGVANWSRQLKKKERSISGQVDRYWCPTGPWFPACPRRTALLPRAFAPYCLVMSPGWDDETSTWSKLIGVCTDPSETPALWGEHRDHRHGSHGAASVKARESSVCQVNKL